LTELAVVGGGVCNFLRLYVTMDLISKQASSLLPLFKQIIHKAMNLLKNDA
jgi:hypothetical protein